METGTEVVALKAEVGTWPARARGLLVTNQERYAEAGEMLVTVKGLQKKIEETFDPIIAKANAAHKEALAQKKIHWTPLGEAETTLKRSMGAYTESVERARRAEAAELEAEARARAEELRLARALELEAAGDKEEAAAVIEEPIAIVRPQPTIAAPVASGVSSRVTWSAAVTDKRKLIAFVASHPEWESLLEVNMPALNAMARTQQAAFAIPGVEARSSTSMSARA